MELIGDIKTYDWGRIGTKSQVALLSNLNDTAFAIDENVPYAELWMGDHVSGSAKIKSTGEKLSDVIARDNSLIGGLNKLPFLLKVLSVGKPLSIQVHPNKEEAVILHQKRPDLYKDPNHKPELAIALTDFSALCGFRPPLEMYEIIKAHKPLLDLIGDANVEELRGSNSPDGIKKCFSTLMRSTEEDFTKCINSILNETQNEKNKEIISKFIHLNNEYPKDVGSLCVFFLNILELKAGQAIFLPAKEPHAYIFGNCIECMACSDNVVRAGLTPKFKDVDTLLDMLNYVGESGVNKIFKEKQIDKFAHLFAPNGIDDFCVIKYRINKETVDTYELNNRKYGSILIVISGSAVGLNLELKEGSIVFLSSDIKAVSLKVDTNQDFIAYQAMFNDF